ncbi:MULTISPECIES: hypothetical protein [Fusobacterium]|jgi:hypothetical protein|uniref:Uncharacterized protein n=2 Tax=Fusobacterium periodonticum TaxID=860 RepID=A0AAD0HX31_9FUSO|nr:MULTISPECIES: hypothetical protein [Fusobacterium]ATV64719.1 hypothetical protein CTM78_10200 [Fusobacterium pseudoperiodonticum]AVQ25972.1 hypothetical protein C4N17_10160 [Fusobacterium periodonticum]KGE61671.1 hypothetical protein FSAG_002245 [Fusobacterium periodonticum 2_1_31]MBF1192112.1 hypothetical protein [Fusobacterium periodonticum]MBF1213622.1 hypothetical protein [Fusobacterium periodonticum]
MGKLSKTLTILGGAVLAGVAYSLWKDKQDLEEENDELYDEIAALKKKNMEQDLEENIITETNENSEDIVL